MDNDDINDFLPSILNPRTVKKQNISLTQNSVFSRCSLSLKKSAPPIKQTSNRSRNQTCFPTSLGSKNTFSPEKIHDFSDFDDTNKENNNSDLNATGTILTTKRHTFLTENEFATASTVNLTSLENRDSAHEPQIFHQNVKNRDPKNQSGTEKDNNKETEDEISVGFSIFKDETEKSSPINTQDINIVRIACKRSLRSNSSATQFDQCDDTLAYDLKEEYHVSLLFGVNNCKCVDITTKNTSIKKISVTHKDNDVNVKCEIVERLTESATESEFDENMNETSPNSLKRSAIAVNLEIKKKKLSTEDAKENSKVLILKTDAIEKLSHVIVNPPNYKLVKRHILDRSKFQNSSKKTVIGQVKNGKNGKCAVGDNLKQIPIDSFLAKVTSRDLKESGRDADTEDCIISVSDDSSDMSKNLGVADAIKCDRTGRVPCRSDWKGHDASPRSIKILSGRPDTASPKRQEAKAPVSDAPRSPSIRGHDDSVSSHSPRKNFDSIQFNLATKSKTSRTPGSARHIPHYKIVAGTHFAVDAFSYGDIPHVKHYFLTHFHSDHYAGLKKSFNKLLYCSKITGDLCVSRLGVNPKCIHVLNLDNSIRIESVEVTAVDANHCPGAVMLVFCLPNGKTILHTGDFRACPTMESYPMFWNKDIHTIYLDTTYCNSRYDFPTQDQSLEMALALLRQKKMALEKNGKKFSSVLIVCGTYTIGKEKFFLGMARRVGCSVWACPEKDKVLQAVEGRSFSHAPPQSCQLHVVPMRDLSHDKLKSYLESLHGAFTEVVAFKPSGWENGKNSTVEKDSITIHGIPYSEHSSFSELIRFVKFLKPKQVVPTVDISGGIKAVQKYFPCPLVYKEDSANQSKVTEYFSIQGRQQASAVT